MNLSDIKRGVAAAKARGGRSVTAAIYEADIAALIDWIERARPQIQLVQWIWDEFCVDGGCDIDG